MRDPAYAGKDHQYDLEDFHPAHQAGFFMLVGDLAGRGRAQHERQDEQSGDQIVEQADIQVGPRRSIEGDDGDQRGLEEIVVERAEELRAEERCEASLHEQRELAGSGQRFTFDDARQRGRCRRCAL